MALSLATHRLSAAAPIVFVLLWSTGFIAAKAGLEHSGPISFLTIRFALVAILMLGVVVVMRARWPRGIREYGHLAILGIFMQIFYFGGAWISMSTGVGAATTALVVSLHPVLTALLAKQFLEERVTIVQWTGFFLGVAGVILVVEQNLGLGFGTLAGILWSVAAMFGITIGTIYQKRFCPEIDAFTGGFVQFVLATAVLLPFAVFQEGWHVTWTMEFTIALIWVSVFLSIISLTLLTLLIKQGHASRVASLFFLVPPVTAVMAWGALGETMSGLAVAGMILAVVGVSFVMSPATFEKLWRR